MALNRQLKPVHRHIGTHYQDVDAVGVGLGLDPGLAGPDPAGAPAVVIAIVADGSNAADAGGAEGVGGVEGEDAAAAAEGLDQAVEALDPDLDPDPGADLAPVPALVPQVRRRAYGAAYQVAVYTPDHRVRTWVVGVACPVDPGVAFQVAAELANRPGRSGQGLVGRWDGDRGADKGQMINRDIPVQIAQVGNTHPDHPASPPSLAS